MKATVDLAQLFIVSNCCSDSEAPQTRSSRGLACLDKCQLSRDGTYYFCHTSWWRYHDDAWMDWDVCAPPGVTGLALSKLLE